MVKCSNGFLGIFRSCLSISLPDICGKEKCVNANEVTYCIRNLKSLYKVYDDRDILIPMSLSSFSVSFWKRSSILSVKNVVARKFHKSGPIFCSVATCWETSILRLLLETLRTLYVSRTLVDKKFKWKSNKKTLISTEI